MALFYLLCTWALANLTMAASTELARAIRKLPEFSGRLVYFGIVHLIIETRLRVI